MDNETFFREMWKELARTGSDSKKNTIVARFEDCRRLECGACEEVKGKQGLLTNDACWCVRCPVFAGENSEKVDYFQCERNQVCSPYAEWRRNVNFHSNPKERKRWAAVIANMPWRTLRPRLAWLKFIL